MSANVLKKSVGKLTPSTTSFFLCDIQSRFRTLIYNTETIVHTSRYLTSIAKQLSIPVLATQQYTKVFGDIVDDCFEDGREGYLDLKERRGLVFEKKKFSMLTDEVKTRMELKTVGGDGDGNDCFVGRDNVVLFGIEAHVCVQQTCLDLLEMGKEVHVVVDGVSSQQKYDREIALTRMANAGAYMTTAQSLAFMLMESAEHPQFKAVSKLTVEHMKNPNEFNS